MKVYQVLFVACAFGALWGGQFALEGHASRGAIAATRLHMATPSYSDPSMSVAAVLEALSLEAQAHADPLALDRAQRTADLKLWGGSLLAAASVLGLLAMGVYHLRAR